MWWAVLLALVWIFQDEVRTALRPRRPARAVALFYDVGGARHRLLRVDLRAGTFVSSKMAPLGAVGATRRAHVAFESRGRALFQTAGRVRIRELGHARRASFGLHPLHLATGEIRGARDEVVATFDEEACTLVHE